MKRFAFVLSAVLFLAGSFSLETSAKEYEVKVPGMTRIFEIDDSYRFEACHPFYGALYFTFNDWGNLDAWRDYSLSTTDEFGRIDLGLVDWVSATDDAAMAAAKRVVSALGRMLVADGVCGRLDPPVQEEN